MSIAVSARWRSFSVLVALLMITSPMGIQASAGAESDATGSDLPPPPDGVGPVAVGVDFRGATHDAGDGTGEAPANTGLRTLLIDPPGDPLDDNGVSAQVDNPGAPAGFPYKNTFGWTTQGPDLDRWVRDTEGSIDLEVDMGNMARKADIRGQEDYIMELGYAVIGYWWYDGDGVYDPIPNQNERGVGDDPCPDEPFDIFTVYVNGREIKTFQGHQTNPCAPGTAEISRTFEIVTEGDDPPTWLRIPKNVVTEGKNSVRIVVHDHVLPAYMPYHSKATDGWYVYLASAAIELAAPPWVTNHGWSADWYPAAGNAPWQPTLKNNMKNELRNHFGQDPWRWAHLDGKEPVLMNHYDRKQDFRKSARELRTNVNDHFSDLGFTGKGWLHGHSMGGLVSRYYVESLGGNSKIEKLAQTGSPNLGSWEAHALTYAYWLMYEATDEDYTAKWYWIAPGWPFDCCIEVWRGWRDWWLPYIGAYEHWEGPGRGGDHLADFMLKPPGSNPILAAMNARFPAGGVDYFTVRGDWSVAGGALNFIWAGDGAVGLDSANMNGRIPSRTIDEWHEAIPERVETGRWYARFYTGLNLDSGLPDGAGGNSLSAQASPAEPGPESPEKAITQALITVRAEDVSSGPYQHVVPVGEAGRAIFTVQARPGEGPLGLSLRAPDGSVFTHQADGRNGVTYDELQTGFLRYHLFDVDDAQVGNWRINIDPDDVPPNGGLQLVVGGYGSGSGTMRTYTPRDDYAPGDSITLLAELSNGGPITGATVRATQLAAQGGTNAITLLDDGASGDGAAGDGVYGAIVSAPSAPTTLSYSIVASGPVTRQSNLDVAVSSLVDLTVSNVAGGPASAWGGDEITLTAVLGSAGARAVDGAVQVAFYDGDPEAGGQLLDTVSVTERIPVGGSRTVSLVTVAPTHALDVHVLADTLDLDADLSNNRASATVPFIATPRTVATVTGQAGENGWLLEPATVTLTPSDGSPAPYSATHYQIDGGAVETYAGPFALSEPGAHELRYWSVDQAGNTEPERTIDVKVDLSGPSASWINPRPGNIHVADQRISGPMGQAVVAGIVEVAIQATDVGSGVSEVILTVDGEPRAAASKVGAARFEALWDSSGTSVGDHMLGYIVRDEAGRQTTGQIPVYVAVGRSIQVEKEPADLVARLDPREGAS